MLFFLGVGVIVLSMQSPSTNIIGKSLSSIQTYLESSNEEKHLDLYKERYSSIFDDYEVVGATRLVFDHEYEGYNVYKATFGVNGFKHFTISKKRETL